MRKSKEGMQVGLFDGDMHKAVDLHDKPPAIEVAPIIEEQVTRPRILIGSTNSCPVCGEDIKLSPDGRVKCTKCMWWQGLAE